MKIKTKALLSLIMVIGYFTLLPVFTPTATLVQNTATLATVNGGNAEYVASHSIHSWTNFTSVIIPITIVLVLGWIWWPSKKNVENSEKKVRHSEKL